MLFPWWCCCGSTPTAPCCLPDGTCEVMTEIACAFAGGDWYPDSKSCDDANVDCEPFDPDVPADGQCICDSDTDPTPVNNVIVQINFSLCDPITCSSCHTGICWDAFVTHGSYGRSLGLWILHPLTPTSPNVCTYCDQRGPDDDPTNGVVDLGPPWTCPSIDLVDGAQDCVSGGRSAAVSVQVGVDETNHQLSLAVTDGYFNYGTVCCTKLSGVTVITAYTSYVNETAKPLISATTFSLTPTEWANWCAGSPYVVNISGGSCPGTTPPDHCCADADPHTAPADFINGDITVSIQRGY